MIFRSVTFVGVLAVHLLITVHLAESQQQKFKIGGGAGLALMSNAAVDHGKTAAIGGFLGTGSAITSVWKLAFNSDVLTEYTIPLALP